MFAGGYVLAHALAGGGGGGRGAWRWAETPCARGRGARAAARSERRSQKPGRGGGVVKERVLRGGEEEWAMWREKDFGPRILAVT